MDLLKKWNFTALVYPKYIDTDRFTFEAGTSNKRVTLNYRQWRTSGSTNDAGVRYQVLQLDSSGNVTRFCGEDTIIDYIPNDSSYSAGKLQYNLNVTSMSDLVVRVTSMDSYQVSGFGQIYNY